MALKERNGFWHWEKKIKGERFRESTGFPVRGRAERLAAERKAAELELAVRSEKAGWVEAEVPTVQEWWERYQQTHTLQKRAPERDSQMVRPFLGRFGSWPLDAVKQSDCLMYLNQRRAAFTDHQRRKTPVLLSEGTVQRERSFLQALWNAAIEDGHDMKNPWKGIERKPYEVRDRVLTEEEEGLLMAKLSLRFQRFTKVLLGTGVRLDECRGIDPATDIQWDNRYLRVTGKFGKTRLVPVVDTVLGTLREQLEAEGRLWTQNPQRLREVLQQGSERAGIAHLGPHTMRHTYGWRWLKNGGDIYTLSKILGHATVAVTERHYAHLMKDDLRDAADRVWGQVVQFPQPEA
jgi:integrase